MIVKILKLGEAAKEVEVAAESTVENAISLSGFSRENLSISLNSHPTFDSTRLREGDIICLNPNIKGGNSNGGLC
jgi:hypothetical protein